MRGAGGLTIILLLLMITGVIYGLSAGQGWSEFGEVVAKPWGMVMLLDLYIGLLLFCGWIFFRERSHFVAAVWTILCLLGGNLTTTVYVLTALLSSGGSWWVFWLGEIGAQRGVTERW